MRYLKIDLTDKNVSRKDFLKKERQLVLFPDNLPDFRLPHNLLHDTLHRGGLAECVRPDRIGGTEDNPVYDINVVGIPTLSYDNRQPVITVQHIREAFINVYRQLDENKYDTVAVFYKNGVPAFGGGVAGKLPEDVRTEINNQLNILEQFLEKKITEAELREPYRKAYQARALPYAPAPRTPLQVQNNFWTKWVDRPYYPLSILFRFGPAFLMGYFVAPGLVLSAVNYFTVGFIANLLTGCVSLGIAGITAMLSDMLLTEFFGNRFVTMEFRNPLTVIANEAEPDEIDGASVGILPWLFKLNTQYKMPLEKLEDDLSKYFNQSVSADAAPVFTRYYAKYVMEQYPQCFYERDKAVVLGRDNGTEQELLKHYPGVP